MKTFAVFLIALPLLSLQDASPPADQDAKLLAAASFDFHGDAPPETWDDFTTRHAGEEMACTGDPAVLASHGFPVPRKADPHAQHTRSIECSLRKKQTLLGIPVFWAHYDFFEDKLSEIFVYIGPLNGGFYGDDVPVFQALAHAYESKYGKPQKTGIGEDMEQWQDQRRHLTLILLGAPESAAVSFSDLSAEAKKQALLTKSDDL